MEQTCGIVYDESRGLTWLCSDPTSEGLPSSFIRYKRKSASSSSAPAPPYASSFNRWKRSKAIGVARIRHLVCGEDEITVVTEEYRISMASVLEAKFNKWKTRCGMIRLTYHQNSKIRRKVSWWRFIAGFFIRTIRQITRLLVFLYSKNPTEYHGCICRECIAFNKDGELGMRLCDASPAAATDVRNLDRDLKALKSLMEGILLEPFKDTNIKEFDLPHDLVFFLEDLGKGSAAKDWTRVSFAFFMDRPLFWTPQEKLTFYTHFHDATFVDQSVNYREVAWTVYQDLTLPIHDWIRWIRPDEKGLYAVLLHDPYTHNNVSRFTRNVDNHFKNKCPKCQTSLSRAARLDRITSSCPYFSSLSEYIREAVMIRASEVVCTNPTHGRWIWAQTQLLSTKVELESIPVNVDSDSRFQRFPVQL